MGRGAEKARSQIIHSLAYNNQSMGLVERSVHTLKNILAKNNNLSQLMLDEQIFAVNSKEDGQTGYKYKIL